MPPVTVIARAAGRSLGLGGRAVLVGLGREALRQYRARSQAVPEPPVPAPRGAAVGIAYAAWLCGLVAFLLAVLNVHLFLPAGRSVGVFQLAIGTILLVEGLGLVVRRLPFRRLLAARFSGGGRRGGRPLREAGRARLVGAMLTVLGIVWIGAGVLNALRGATALV